VSVRVNCGTAPSRTRRSAMPATPSSGRHIADLERGKIQELEKFPAATLDVAESKLLAECTIPNWRFGDCMMVDSS